MCYKHPKQYWYAGLMLRTVSEECREWMMNLGIPLNMMGVNGFL